MSHVPALNKTRILNIYNTAPPQGGRNRAIEEVRDSVNNTEVFNEYFPQLGGDADPAGVFTSAATLSNAIDVYNAYATSQDHTPPGGPPTGDNLFKVFETGDISLVEKQTVTSGLWQGGTATATTFYTASLLGATSASHIEIYKNDINSDSSAQVQFSVGYAHYGGSGSIGNTTKTTAGNRETAALYRQFANLLLPSGTSKFTFKNASTTSDDFYFVVFNRAAMREKIDPGNWELWLSGSNNFSTVTKLIDDSGATINPEVNVAGRVYNVVSGSIASGTAVVKTPAASEPAALGAAGLFYPDLGVVLLNPLWVKNADSGSTTLAPGGSTDTFDNDGRKLFNAISGSKYFAARREEQIDSKSYFCRALNTEYNFSANPTYETNDAQGNPGAFTVASFQGNPKSYITQVGLYDSGNNLIAVAKLSQPILKSFSREAVVKVKLDY